MDILLLSDIKEFYPVTDSLSQQKINDWTNFVKNTTFLEMFGLAISNKIFAGTIEDSANDNFVGFRKFTALCVTGLLLEDSFIHTNAGLKMVGQFRSWTEPKMQDKNNPLMKINNTIENQFIEAKKVLAIIDEKPLNKYAGYSAFKIEKI